MSVPRFAVVKLKEGTDTVELYSILVKHGYLEVSFVEKLRDAPQYEETNESKNGPVLKRKRETEDIISGSVSPIPSEDCGFTASSSNTPQSTEKHPHLSNALKVEDCLKAMLKATKNQTKTKSNGRLSNTGLTSIASEFSRPEQEENEIPGSPTSINTEDVLNETSPKATATIIEKKLSAEDAILLRQLNRVMKESQAPLIPTLSIKPDRQMRVPKNDWPSALEMFQDKSPLNCSTSEEEPVACKECNVKLKISRMHCIRYHLAMHWKEKQFSCSKCSHGSHLNGNVKIHIKSNHPEGAEILEKITDEMVDGWCGLAYKCFPLHAEKVVRLLRQRHAERKSLQQKEAEREFLVAINQLTPSFMTNLDGNDEGTVSGGSSMKEEPEDEEPFLYTQSNNHSSLVQNLKAN